MAQPRGIPDPVYSGPIPQYETSVLHRHMTKLRSLLAKLMAPPEHVSTDPIQAAKDDLERFDMITKTLDLIDQLHELERRSRIPNVRTAPDLTHVVESDLYIDLNLN